jgi:hypothetical protein
MGRQKGKNKKRRTVGFDPEMFEFIESSRNSEKRGFDQQIEYMLEIAKSAIEVRRRSA